MRRHRGPARIFATEDHACEALASGALASGDVVVVRGAGPRGDPGMRLLQRFLWQLAARGLHDRIAFVTDGRISGTNKGCAVTQVSPEAAANGPLAAVREGDTIVIDLEAGVLDLVVADDVLQQRLSESRPPASGPARGYLNIYARTAASSGRGAALDYRAGDPVGTKPV